MEQVRERPVVLVIAGSDSGGGAGLQADQLSIWALGGFCTMAVTCITAQNPAGVSRIEQLPPELILEQAKQVLEFFPVRAIKTGMLGSASIVEAVADLLDDEPAIPLVVDPVMVATSGAVLLESQAVETYRERLFPRATLLTPNLDEAAHLLGERATSSETLEAQALQLASDFGTRVLLKGGHLEGDRLVDVLADASGALECYPSRRVHGIDTHGSGCSLASAIAVRLAHGDAPKEAVTGALAWLRTAFEQPMRVGDQLYMHRVET